MSDEHQTAVWDLIDRWADADPAEGAKAALRDRIRRFAFTRRSRHKNLTGATRDRAREALAKLMAGDPVVRHRWLFAAAWVEPSYDELENEAFDFRKRDERIRTSASMRCARYGESAASTG